MTDANLSPPAARPPRPDAFEAVYQTAQLMFRRSFRGWRIFGALAVVALPGIFAVLIRVGGADADDQEEFFYNVLAYFHFGIVVPVVALIFATAFPWPEAEEGTLTYWFTSPVPRWSVLLGRYAAALVLGSLLLPLSVFALGLPLQAPIEAELPRVMRVAATSTLLAYPAYLAIFLFDATWFRRGLAVGVVFIFVENMVSLIEGTSIVRATMIFYVRSLLSHSIPAAARLRVAKDVAVTDPATTAQAFVVFGCVTLAALGLSLWLVERIEYRGRTSQPA